MIITKLYGGLGNQLFEYAAGRALAIKHGTFLALDISLYRDYELHTYSLTPFNIKETFATEAEIRAARRWEAKPGRRWTLYNLLFADRTRFLREKQFTYDAAFEGLGADAYLDGYWQTEKYFKDIESTIRDELTLKKPLSSQSQELHAHIKAVNAVSLHVRHGSYLLPPYNAHHGTCPPEYYTQAIAEIASRVPNPYFFVFSDDRPWAREYIRPDFPTIYVEHTDASTDYEDLFLMSACKHHILANSTFSWWGAWLNQYPEKTVFAPKRWFKGKQWDLSDLFPPGWHII